MKKLAWFALSFIMIAMFAQTGYAEDTIDFEYFSLEKLDGLNYYTRDSELAKDPEYRTTFGYLADNTDTFVAAIFNDQYQIIVDFYPVDYNHALSPKECMIEIFDKCYSIDSGLFDDSFRVYPYAECLYEVFQVSNYETYKVTTDSYYIFTYDGILCVGTVDRSPATSEDDYSYDHDLDALIYKIVKSVDADNLM